jgi:hypothetical protein
MTISLGYEPLVLSGWPDHKNKYLYVIPLRSQHEYLSVHHPLAWPPVLVLPLGGLLLLVFEAVSGGNCGAVRS